MMCHCIMFQPHCCVCVSGSHFYSRDKALSRVYKELSRYVSIVLIINMNIVLGSFTIKVTQKITCDDRKFHKLRLDENNYQVWRDVGLEILSDPTNKVDVSTCCIY